MTKAVIMASWEDVPHISEQQRKDLLESIPIYQRDARSRGIPQLGSGAIYPVPESDIVVPPFEVPHHWPRVYSMDVGWNRTAVVWAAIDRETDTTYLYNEYYRAHAEPSVHAAAVRARGAWMMGVIDPAARGRSQSDGGQLMQDYLDLGLILVKADNAVESGLLDVWQRMSAGRLKVFNTLPNWLTEFRLYRRDEKGRVVKTMDHLMDATRYLINSGLEIAALAPDFLERSGLTTPQQKAASRGDYDPYAPMHGEHPRY